MTALTLAVAYVVGAVGVARATRLVLNDHYPPAIALRRWWWNQTVGKGGWRAPWHLLLVGETPDTPGCPFCLAPWIAAAALASAVVAGIWSPDMGTLAGWWWLLAVWASGSYAAAMVVLRDEPPDEPPLDDE